jgi:hypothetical protein
MFAIFLKKNHIQATPGTCVYLTWPFDQWPPLTTSNVNFSRLYSHDRHGNRIKTLRSSSGSSSPTPQWSLFENDVLLPSKVTCSLSITLDDKRLSQQPEIFNIPWQKKAAFKILTEEAQKGLKNGTVLEDNTLGQAKHYLRNGCFRIVGKRHRSHPRVLEHGEQVVEAFVFAISGFILDYPYEPFSLDVKWDFSTICIEKIPGEAYKDPIRRELYRKMKMNYRSRAYISRTDLIQILSPETSGLIIDHDESIPLEEKAALKARVRSRPEILQAVCVYAQLPMRCLQRLLEKDFHDNHRPREKSDCLHEDGWDWEINFGKFLDHQASFFAYKFPAPGQSKNYDHIPDDVVVPISYNTADTLGEGAFSIVYKALIDPVHHYFSKVRCVSTDSVSLKVTH